MDKELKRLRQKFIGLSAGISLLVLALMLLTLNLLMRAPYQKEKKAAAEVLLQTACSHAPSLDTETFSLEELETNEDGDWIIPRSPSRIAEVTLHGTIRCENPDASWYCAGGGLLFAQKGDSGQPQYVHKEYSFNRDNTEITIPVADAALTDENGNTFSADEIALDDTYFMVSIVWWTSSSDMFEEDPPEVTLTLERVEIRYREQVSVASHAQYPMVQRGLEEMYPDGLPETLDSCRCFYLITDRAGNLAEINSATMQSPVSVEAAQDLLQNAKNDDYVLDGVTYDCVTENTDTLCVYAFFDNGQMKQNTHRLLLVSVLSGGGIYLLVVLLIVLASKKAVKPVLESYQRQTQFISNASHELKTPITVIAATTELMETKNGADHLTECLSTQTEKMSRLVNEMLALTRLSEPERQKVAPERFDLSRTVSHAVLSFEGMAYEAGKHLKAELAPNLFCNGSADKVDALVGILLDNALKYSDASAEIRMRLFAKKDRAMLICSNPCSDFSADAIPFLFDRFYRADLSHSDEKKGFGLGLSIAKEIVDLHGGEISVRYQDGTVEVCVMLPMV